MKYTCPICNKVIQADYMHDEVMKEIFKHEKTHKEGNNED
jgi:hypothetical protein